METLSDARAHLGASWVGPLAAIILVRDAEALLMTAITVGKQLVSVSPQLPSLLHILFYYLHGHYYLHFIAVIVTIYLTNAGLALFLSPPSVSHFHSSGFTRELIDRLNKLHFIISVLGAFVTQYVLITAETLNNLLDSLLDRKLLRCFWELIHSSSANARHFSCCSFIDVSSLALVLHICFVFESTILYFETEQLRTLGLYVC